MVEFIYIEFRTRLFKRMCPLCLLAHLNSWRVSQRFQVDENRKRRSVVRMIAITHSCQNHIYML